jgi:hypothetical protein
MTRQINNKFHILNHLSPCARALAINGLVYRELLVVDVAIAWRNYYVTLARKERGYLRPSFSSLFLSSHSSSLISDSHSSSFISDSHPFLAALPWLFTHGSFLPTVAFYYPPPSSLRDIVSQSGQLPSQFFLQHRFFLGFNGTVYLRRDPLSSFCLNISR